MEGQLRSCGYAGGLRTCWSFLEVISCRKSAVPLRGGSRKPSDSKKGTTCSRGPW